MTPPQSNNARRMTTEDANNAGRELYAATFKDKDACRKRWDEGLLSDERRQFYVDKALAGVPLEKRPRFSAAYRKPLNDGYRW